MGSAKEVLDMPEVREAIDEHAKDPSAGWTRRRRLIWSLFGVLMRRKRTRSERFCIFFVSLRE